jgi:APA family basic amino acid/polyamine antiporter
MAKGSEISVAVAMAVGLGAIIGAGIFVLSGTAIALSGAYSLIAFVFVGIVALLVAFELGALGMLMPHAKGASYSYVYEAFGSEMGFITGIMLYFSFATAVSAVALGFGSYLGSMLGVAQHTYEVIFAMALILVLSLVNIIGIRKAAKADAVLVSIKLGVLSLFILFAVLFLLLHPHVIPANFATPASEQGIGAIFAASVAIFFAYTGFQTISTFTDRVKGGPAKAAKAIVLSVVVSLIVYVLVDASLMFLAPASSYKIAADPLAFALKSAAAPSWLSITVDIGALIATVSATIAMIMASSRTVYQISKDHLLPGMLRKYNTKRDVAANGVIVTAIVGIIMLFSGNIYIIAAISNFGLLFAYIMSSLAAIQLKRTHGDALRMPAHPYLPLVTIAALLALIIGMPKEALILGSALIMALIVVYYFFRAYENKKVIRIKLFK